MELQEALTDFVNELQSINGLRRVPDEPPESNDQFPFAVLLPLSGVYKTGPPGLMVGLHDVSIELHILRKDDLAREYSQIMDLIDELPKKLYQAIRDATKFVNFTFGGSGEGIEYKFMPMEWAGEDTIGVIYTVRSVKVTMDIT